MDGRNVEYKELKSIMQENPDSQRELSKARANIIAAWSSAAITGACVAYPIASSLAGGDPKWYLMGVAAGTGVLTYAFMAGYNKRTRNAVALYNAGLFSPAPNSYYHIGITGNGLGIAFCF